MIDQEDDRLLELIQNFGCYFMCILYLAGKQEWTAGQINQFYFDLLTNGNRDITEDCTVEAPEAVFEALGIKVKQILNLDGSVAIPVEETVPGGYEILCYKWPAKGYTHFVVGDGHGRLVYDPIHRGANTVKKGVLDSKRLFALA